MKNDEHGTHNADQTPLSKTIGDVDLLGEMPIWTPEIERLLNSVCVQQRMGFPGIAVDGQQRCGKSGACKFLQATLPNALGFPVATVLWSIPEFCKTERDFVQERMRDSKCLAVFHRDIAVLRSRLYDHLTDLAQQEGSRKVVIIVDEAQNLTRDQYHYLHHCDNNLRNREIRPFFVLVGQPELRQTSSSWVKSNGHQVVGRFFSYQHTYRGIALADVLSVVQGFDEPEGDEGTVTYGKALPEAVMAGWRLSQTAPLLVEAIGAVAAKQNITSGVRLPMQSLRAMLLSILWHYIETRKDPATFDMRVAINAIHASRFPTVMEYYVHVDNSERAAA